MKTQKGSRGNFIDKIWNEELREGKNEGGEKLREGKNHMQILLAEDE